MPASFFDTNVLLYLVSGDQEKADKAEAIVGEGGEISIQVLNELANVARRKMKKSWLDTHAFLDLVQGLVNVRPLTLETHQAGLELAERYGFSLYDSMIVASALLAGCDRLWSEDMQDGMVVEGTVRIVNPFRL